MKMLTVFDFLSDLQKTVLFYFMHHNYDLATKVVTNVNARYLSFCEAVGDDPTTRTELQEQERQQMFVENPDLFVCSFIYSNADKYMMRYDPQSALDRKSVMVVYPVSKTIAND
jgi:hypothetical protein